MEHLSKLRVGRDRLGVIPELLITLDKARYIILDGTLYIKDDNVVDSANIYVSEYYNAPDV